MHAGQEGVEEMIGSWVEVAGVWRSRGSQLDQLGLEGGDQEGREGKALVLSGAITDRLLVGLQSFSFFPQNFDVCTLVGQITAYVSGKSNMVEVAVFCRR